VFFVIIIIIMNARFLLPRLRALFAKKKRVRELGEAKITLGDEIDHEPQQANQINYMEMRKTLDSLAWETMSFDRLCSLPGNIMEAIQLEVKKDKFNVDDS